MTDLRRSPSGNSPRGLVISGLFLVLPLVLGARDCEDPEDPVCDSGDCGPSAGVGEAGRGEAGKGGSGTAGTGGGNAAGRGGSGGGDGCLYAGESYDVGDSFPSDDGCNSCSCTAGGLVACTLRACANTCGGLTGQQCARGQYCNFPPDAQCGAADQTGTCEEMPSACTRQYDPVCGCDDMTYGNACDAAANGVSVLHDGECDGGSAGDGSAGSAGDGSAGNGGAGNGGGSGQTCGGIASLECPSDDEFCNYEESAGGQGCDGSISDAGGVCQTRPQACTLQYDPVCGCDRRTHGNACGAHSAGASVLHDGPCTEVDCEAIGGHVVFGTGPGPMCPPGEEDYGAVELTSGQIPIEGAICCVP